MCTCACCYLTDPELCTNEREKCVDCRDSWKELCTSIRSCDFSSGDGEYDNQRESGALWCCLCWGLSFCLLCPCAIFKTFRTCLYVLYRLCRGCVLYVLLCDLCCQCSVCTERNSPPNAQSSEDLV